MANETRQSGHVNVANLNNAIQETLIHIDLTKTFYSITPSELNIIEDGSNSIWKDITLAATGIGLPCIINALIQNQKSPIFNSEIFWNSLIGCVSLIIAVIFGIIWAKSKNKCTELIKEIKQRPPYKVQ